MLVDTIEQPNYYGFQTVHEWLIEFRDRRRRARYMRSKIAELRSLAESPKCRDFPAVIVALDELQERWLFHVSALETEICEMEIYMKQLPSRYAYILSQYYFEGKSLIKISQEIYHGYTYTSRLKSEAEIELGKIILKRVGISDVA